MKLSLSPQSPGRKQRGVTTLVVVLSLLVIITLVVLASSTVAVFEQRSAANENRQKLVDQASEYALNMSGEYMKSFLPVIATNTGTGWLVSAGASKRWWPCPAYNASTPHPCDAERDTTRRGNMYFWAASSGGSTAVPYSGTGALTAIGGDSGSVFPVTTTVNALLCRIDTSLTTVVAGLPKPSPDCRLDPSTTSQNRISVTLVATSGLTNSAGTIDESSRSVIKETWASISGGVGVSAVPLVASGSIEGLGNAEIVASANGAGIGLPVSIWSACPVDIEKSAGQVYPGNCVSPPGSGVGSVSTCHLGEFLKNTPEADLKTTCATSNPACGCPSFNTANNDFLSGHSNSNQRENVDILDVDANAGLLPDITFFPDRGLDDPADSLDDNLFEWVFGTEAVAEGATVVTGCGASLTNIVDTKQCYDVKALIDDMGASVIDTCASLNSASSGLYYVTGDCDLPSQVGSSTSSVVVVVDGDNQGGASVRVSGNSTFFGMLFIRSRYTMENNLNNVKLVGNGNVQFYGSVVVEGNVKITGGIRIVYENTSLDTPGKPLPNSTKFARVPGSWLDAARTF
jgi:Tfp pilus assembly protein PilX